MSRTDDPLTRLLKAWRPQRLLAIGEDAARPLRDYAGAENRCALDIVETNDAAGRLLSLPSEQHYDFALVAGFLERVDSATGSAVIARLRDVLARRLCVVIESAKVSGSETVWSDAELSAFGFTLLSRLDQSGDQVRLYGFDIASYKQTPDWLSPRHWAHPELWGKFRW